jgi:hypothetical protein
MRIASVVLNILSVVSLPMVLAFAVMTTDSPHTPKHYIRILQGILIIHLAVVIASIALAWRLRAALRPGLALAAGLSPAVWLVLAFIGVALFVNLDPPGKKGPR